MERQSQVHSVIEPFSSLDHYLLEFLQELSPLTEQQINTAPFPGSWTTAQTTRHIIKSNNSISQAMSLPGKNTERPPDQRVQELKDLFLDFTLKFHSAPFITPTRNSYDKARLIADLKRSADLLKVESSRTGLNESIHHPAFGEITKLELLYFVLFHTQRHLRQVKNIVRSTKGS